MVIKGFVEFEAEFELPLRVIAGLPIRLRVTAEPIHPDASVVILALGFSETLQFEGIDTPFTLPKGNLCLFGRPR